MRRDIIITVLATFCLTATLFIVLPSRSMDKDPWADVSSSVPGAPDNIVDMKDIAYEISRFRENETGIPRSVWVQGYLSNTSSHVVNVAAKSSGSLNITTDGYKQVTVGFRANHSIGALPYNNGTQYYAEARTGFLLDSQYDYSDWFAITETNAVPYPYSWPEPYLWIDPTYAVIPNLQIGYTFNVTVRIRESYSQLNISGAQASIEYDRSNLNMTRVFEPTWDPEYIFYNKTTIFASTRWMYPGIPGKSSITFGENLGPGELNYSRGNGKIGIVEFNITQTPRYGEQPCLLHVIDADTFLLDGLTYIPIQKFDAIVQWGFDCTMKTYAVTGPILTIEYYNPSDDSIELTIEAYITT